MAEHDLSPDPVRAAVEFLVEALAGAVPPDEVNGRLAPRLTARGDVGRMLGGSPRLATFREHRPVIEQVEIRRAWSARAAVRTGPALWELDVDVEPVPPHRVSSFQPRRVPDDAVAWSTIGPTLRSTGDDDISRRLAEAADTLHLAGLTAGIAVRGEVVYDGQFGVADLASRERLRPESVFRVGSVTKTITALAVLALAHRGAIDLDAPVGRYLPEPAPPGPGGEPTVGDLLVHRGGLPKDMPAQGLRRAWAPGERAEYSNVGYDLLGIVIEQVAGAPYATFCRDHVLVPYGLTHATMQDPGSPAPADVTGYRVAAGRLSPAPAAVATYPAAGGMTASNTDLLTLAGLLTRAEDPVVREALARTTPAGPGVRFAAGGFAVLDRPSGPILWRGGATDGFTAEIVAALDGSGTVVLLASKSPPEGLREVALGLLEHLPAKR
ncbi:serine hydrolase domain-containing protein [Paractinoplanes globisporus]|uniref:Serine hydrolase domain-containing protein n=1 Tax=Paractinoplanes globisporus TaxID=113565 RepID=A0ABW6WCP0_9ACTN|nr:serine hydrolase domain-containing protein [Actinoplanes globisporus]